MHSNNILTSWVFFLKIFVVQPKSKEHNKKIHPEENSAKSGYKSDINHGLWSRNFRSSFCVSGYLQDLNVAIWWIFLISFIFHFWQLKPQKYNMIFEIWISRFDESWPVKEDTRSFTLYTCPRFPCLWVGMENHLCIILDVLDWARGPYIGCRWICS